MYLPPVSGTSKRTVCVEVRSLSRANHLTPCVADCVQESHAPKDTMKYDYRQDPPFNLAPVTQGELLRTDHNPDYINRKVGSVHNVWAFGMAMYELLNHERAKDFSDRVNGMTEFDYFAWDQQTIPNITTHRQPDYSQQLRDLIRWCLNLRPSLRPTVKQILGVTGPMMEYYEGQVAKSNSNAKNWFQRATYRYQLPKVYFKENEINHMPLGRHLNHFGVNDQLQAEFVFEQDNYAAPVWGPIQHPRRMVWARRYQNLAEQNR